MTFAGRGLEESIDLDRVIFDPEYRRLVIDVLKKAERAAALAADEPASGQPSGVRDLPRAV
jgi:hypothetical protein